MDKLQDVAKSAVADAVVVVVVQLDEVASREFLVPVGVHGVMLANDHVVGVQVVVVGVQVVVVLLVAKDHVLGAYVVVMVLLLDVALLHAPAVLMNLPQKSAWPTKSL